MAMSAQPLERRVNRLENDVTSIYEILHRVENTQNVHGQRLDSIDRRLESMDGRLDSIDGRLDQLGGQVAIVIDLLERK